MATLGTLLVFFGSASVAFQARWAPPICIIGGLWLIYRGG
ncbi:hypothetical protein ABIF65_010978 [Bradyrhizobium japonicum]|nr:hypothetical protein [Bradyrhizobium japonicum]MCP1776691.1 hypothetical protein [Bradyrhizobium japonicum]MCP1856223.1 hypothetical protein [Bradyrhizobium japonicum]MCP1896968.1 hypothetical protein [Bradyrhizobium japonicum]MCP1960308.1 hypothetical protein [Bradyrhizobium japonicum]